MTSVWISVQIGKRGRDSTNTFAKTTSAELLIVKPCPSFAESVPKRIPTIELQSWMASHDTSP